MEKNETKITWIMPSDTNLVGCYAFEGNRMPITINHIAYVQGIEGVFDYYMQSDDWQENYHHKFLLELLSIDGIKDIEELKGASGKPFMVELIKDVSADWYEIVSKLEGVLMNFHFDFNYPKKEFDIPKAT